MEDHILDAVEADPKISMSQVSTQLGVFKQKMTEY